MAMEIATMTYEKAERVKKVIWIGPKETQVMSHSWKECQTKNENWKQNGSCLSKAWRFIAVKPVAPTISGLESIKSEQMTFCWNSLRQSHIASNCLHLPMQILSSFLRSHTKTLMKLQQCVLSTCNWIYGRFIVLQLVERFKIPQRGSTLHSQRRKGNVRSK